MALIGHKKYSGYYEYEGPVKQATISIETTGDINAAARYQLEQEVESKVNQEGGLPLEYFLYRDSSTKYRMVLEYADAGRFVVPLALAVIAVVKWVLVAYVVYVIVAGVKDIIYGPVDPDTGEREKKTVTGGLVTMLIVGGVAIAGLVVLAYAFKRRS